MDTKIGNNIDKCGQGYGLSHWQKVWQKLLHVCIYILGCRKGISRRHNGNIALEHRKNGTETLVFSMISGNQDILPNRPDRPRKE